MKALTRATLSGIIKFIGCINGSLASISSWRLLMFCITCSQSVRLLNAHTDRQTDRWTDGLTDRQTVRDRQTDRLTGRQTHR